MMSSLKCMILLSLSVSLFVCVCVFYVMYTVFYECMCPHCDLGQCRNHINDCQWCAVLTCLSSFRDL